MTKKLIKPSWYINEFYNKNKTAEEWLCEIWKRHQFDQDNIGLPYSIHTLSTKEQEEHFIDSLFNTSNDKILNCLKATPAQPIRYPAISDIFIMYHTLTNTNYYKHHPQRILFEEAIASLLHGHTLSRDQHRAFYEMYNTPWCVFNENHEQDNWCPKKDYIYLTGIPVSIDPAYKKEDTIKILNTKLNKWVGKIQSIQKQFDRWHESKILAVFDLMRWHRIKRNEYTNIGLHKLIWPQNRVSKLTGGEVNPYDDIDHSIGLANQVITSNVISSLLILCEAVKYKNEIITT